MRRRSLATLLLPLLLVAAVVAVRGASEEASSAAETAAAAAASGGKTSSAAAEPGWKQVDLIAHMKGKETSPLLENLRRVSKKALGIINEYVKTSKKFSGCHKFSHIQLRPNAGIQYKFWCEANVHGLKDPRRLKLEVWDLFGNVQLQDFRDHTESDSQELQDALKHPWYYDQTHLPKDAPRAIDAELASPSGGGSG